MQTHNLVQGSPEWKAYRAKHFNASDAPAMMGCSPYKTRTQLLDELSTGIAAEPDVAQQKRFDAGHRNEALARPLAEEFLGEELYPVTGSEGDLSASFDGLTLLYDKAFEHKTLNAELRAAFEDMATLNPEHRERSECRCLPLMYRVQMEQQLLVSGAECVLFMASDWSGEELIEERHCWYWPDFKLREQIVAGWTQFRADLANHKPAQAAPKAAGAAPELLPALRIEVTGAVTASNLDAFKSHALQVFGGIKRDLQTDQDFADAEATVKWCAGVEDRLAAAKQHALSQTESIDALFRAIDEISAEARRTRLDLDKLVKARKDSIRLEIVSEAQQELRAHVAELNRAGQWPKPMVPAPAPDFAGAIKGKRSIDSIRDAVGSLLAAAKAEANQTALLVTRNLAAMAGLGAAQLPSMFPDLQALAVKASEDFEAIVRSRLAQHEAEQRAAAERAAAAEARRKAEAEQAAAMAAQTPAAAPIAKAAEPVPAPVPLPAAAAAEPATLPLGEICARLGFTTTADFLSGLGFEAQREGSARRYRESDFPRICDALIAHIAGCRAKRAAALA